MGCLMTMVSSILRCYSCLDYEAIVKLSEDFNGADLRNVCTEAGKWFSLW